MFLKIVKYIKINLNFLISSGILTLQTKYFDITFNYSNITITEIINLICKTLFKIKNFCNYYINISLKFSINNTH